MNKMYLNIFTQNTNFPFFIQYGHHDDSMFLHTHADFSELTIVLSGTAIHVVNNEKYLIKKGDVFVIGENISHGYENPHDFKICNIMYRLNELLWSDSDIRDSVGFHALFIIEPFFNKESKFKSRLQLSVSDFEIVSTKIAFMLNEYTTRPEGWKTMLYTTFMNLVVLLSRAYHISPDCSDNVLNMALSVAYIGNHYQETISIEFLARQAHLSVRHFSRVFRNLYNVSPINYIIQYRIQCSYPLLKDRNLTISEVAYKSGFNDSNYFSRQFKKMTGFSPIQYRQFLI